MGNPLVDSAHKGPVLCCVNVPFVVELNKLLSKHLSIQWYEMPCCPCDIVVMHSEARRKLTFWRRHFKIHFCEDCCISNQISLMIFPKVLIDNKSALGVDGGVGVGGCAIWVNHRKLILKSNLVKSHSSITSISVVQIFWNCVESTTVSLPCSAENLKTIWQMQNILWNKI